MIIDSYCRLLIYIDRMEVSDREKVLKGLNYCTHKDGAECPNCPYWQDDDCVEALHADFLALLKEQDDEIAKFCGEVAKLTVMLEEQESKWIHREDLDFKDKLGCNHFHGMCENCGFIHDFIDYHTGQYRYCPQCGRSMKNDSD